MGLGGYLAAKSEADHYHTEREREGKKKNLLPFCGPNLLNRAIFYCSTRGGIIPRRRRRGNY